MARRRAKATRDFRHNNPAIRDAMVQKYEGGGLDQSNVDPTQVIGDAATALINPPQGVADLALDGFFTLGATMARRAAESVGAQEIGGLASDAVGTKLPNHPIAQIAAGIAAPLAADILGRHAIEGHRWKVEQAAQVIENSARQQALDDIAAGKSPTWDASWNKIESGTSQPQNQNILYASEPNPTAPSAPNGPTNADRQALLRQRMQLGGNRPLPHRDPDAAAGGWEYRIEHNKDGVPQVLTRPAGTKGNGGWHPIDQPAPPAQGSPLPPPRAMRPGTPFIDIAGTQAGFNRHPLADIAGAPRDAFPGAKLVQMDARRIKTSPEDFQFKTRTDPTTGAGKTLSDVEEWNPFAAGVMTAWRSPEGEYYIVNGHHRLELLNRIAKAHDWNERLPVWVQILDSGHGSKDATLHGVSKQQARALGAEINILDGRGDAIDFAKFMRDTGATPEDLIKRGASKSYNTLLRDADALRGLNDHLFAETAIGRFPLQQAIVMGRQLGGHPDQQEALFRTIRQIEESGRRIDPEQLSEAIKHVKGAGTVDWTQNTLFGKDTFEKSLAMEAGKVSNEVRDRLRSDKRLFRAVGEHEDRLRNAGTPVDVAQAAERERAAIVHQKVLDVTVHTPGTPANKAVRGYAEELLKTPARKQKALFDRAYEDVYQAIDKSIKKAFPDGIPADRPVENVAQEVAFGPASKTQGEAAQEEAHRLLNQQQNPTPTSTPTAQPPAKKLKAVDIAKAAQQNTPAGGFSLGMQSSADALPPPAPEPVAPPATPSAAELEGAGQSSMFGSAPSAAPPMRPNFVSNGNEFFIKRDAEGDIESVAMRPEGSNQEPTPVDNIADVLAGRTPTEVRDAMRKAAKSAGDKLGQTTLHGTLIPGVDRFIAQDVAPMVRRAARTASESMGALKRTFAIRSAAPEAETAASLVSRRNAQAENDFTRVVSSLEKSRKVFRAMPRADIVDFIDRMERGTAQSSRSLDLLASQLRTILDTQRERIRSFGKGALQNYYENYFPHLWKDPKAAEQLYSSLRGSLEGSKDFLRQRSIDFFAKGINAGLEPVSWNPADLVMLKYYEMGKYIRGQRVFGDLKDHGWATYVPNGKMDEYIQKGKIPAGWQPINDKIARVGHWSDTEGAFIQRGNYYAPAAVSRLIDNHLSPGLRHISGTETTGPYDAVRALNNTLNQLQLGLSAFHVATTTAQSSTSHFALSIQRAFEGDIAGAARHLGYSVPGVGVSRDMALGRKMYREFYGYGQYSGTNAFRAFLRGDIKGAIRGAGGISYGPEIQQAVKDYIESGAHFDQARPFIDNWGQSFADALANHNPIGAAARAPFAAIETLAKPIFQYLVPRVKAAAFLDLAQHELGRLGADATADERLNALSAVQNSIDNRFGELNYDKLFWNNKMKDLAFVLFRAPGWNIGSAREIVGGLKDLLPSQIAKNGLSSRAAYTLAFPMMAAIYGMAYQYAKTGTVPKIARDSAGNIDGRQSIINFMAPETGRTLADGRPERVWIPGYQKDVYSVAAHPAETLFHKTSPILEQIYYQYENQDYFHRQIADPDAPLGTRLAQRGAFSAQGGEPITIQNLLRRRQDATQARTQNAGLSAESFLGFTPASRDVTNSRMMNFIDDRLRARSPQGGETPEQFERGSAIRQIEGDVRGGKAPNISDALRRGVISHGDIVRALKMARMPYLAARFQELDLKGAIRAYQLGSAQERAQVLPILRQKLNPKALLSLPPMQRAEVFQMLKGALASPAPAGG